MPKALIAGPCMSEFGWELMEWQGYVRALAADYDKVVVCSTAGHEALYADYDPIFVGHKLKGNRDCHRIREVENPQELKRVQEALKGFKYAFEQAGYEVKWESPQPPKNRAVGRRRPVEIQKFVKFGRRNEDDLYDLTIHARNRPFKFALEGHNYPIEKWYELLAMLRDRGYKRIAAIGTHAQALAPEGVEDLRGVDLQRVMDVMASSRLVIGPSSGPMHLASLCGVPHAVWARGRRQSAVNTRNRERYESYWNPHRTPTKVILHGDKEVVPPISIVDMISVLEHRRVIPMPPHEAMHEKRCVVFVATGEEYVKSAAMCIDSLRRAYSGHIMLLTDRSYKSLEELSTLNVTVKVVDTGETDKRLSSRVLKTQVMQICPYELGLFIDADALVLSKIDKLWGLLPEGDDIAMTLSQHFPRIHDAKRAHWMSHPSYSNDFMFTAKLTGPKFPHYSSSTMLWRRTDRTIELSKKWYEEWRRFHGCDMFPLARAIHAIKPSIVELPRVYNTRYHMQDDTVIYTAKLHDIKRVYKRLFPKQVPQVMQTVEKAVEKSVKPGSNRPIQRTVRSPRSKVPVPRVRKGTQKTLRQLLAERHTEQRERRAR